MIKAIFATDQNGGIARDGIMPWPKDTEDLRRFQKLTRGQVVVMGRNTWDAVDMPSPLPNRLNVVVTSRPLDLKHEQVQSCRMNELPETLRSLESKFSTVWVIGGAQLLEHLHSAIDEVYITEFVGDFSCDTTINFDLAEFTFVSRECSENKKWEIWHRAKLS